MIIQPNNNTEIIIDSFILMAKIHLTTVSGITITTSLYPGGFVGPGIINWTGYNVP